MLIRNIAFYKFVALDRLPDLRARFRAQCRELGLVGTILLAPEGINGFLAGQIQAIEEIQAFLTGIVELKGLEFKFSHSEQAPFGKLKIKLKKEIIPFGLPDIRPDQHTGMRLQPEEFKLWLDEGRPVWILDTRNEYEVRHGTFENSLDLNLQRFRDFPQRWHGISERLGDRPVVMFCTGGIRCEKASAFALQTGHRDVYQLEGGILKYFEKCGAEHFRGNCFVFDERTALDEELEETH